MKHGEAEISKLDAHFFNQDNIQTQLQTKWKSFKFYVNKHLKPQCSTKSSLVAFAAYDAKERHLNHFSQISNILYIAEVAATLPVNNAWPEHGFSALKIANLGSEVH